MPKKQTYSVLFCTTGSIEEAERMATSLVERRLAACVNIVPSLTSIYRWENKICRENEALMVIKTQQAKIPALEEAIRSLHSYQTPELIELPIKYGMKEYLQWIDTSLAPE